MDGDPVAGPRDPEPRQVADDRIVQREPPFVDQLEDDRRGERLADRADLEERAAAPRAARGDVGVPRDLARDDAPSDP